MRLSFCHCVPTALDHHCHLPYVVVVSALGVQVLQLSSLFDVITNIKP